MGEQQQHREGNTAIFLLQWSLKKATKNEQQNQQLIISGKTLKKGGGERKTNKQKLFPPFDLSYKQKMHSEALVIQWKIFSCKTNRILVIQEEEADF